LKASASVTATNVNAPNGTPTADQVTIAGSGFFLQQVTVVPGTTYTVSFYALAGTATTVNYFIYNVTAASTLVGVVNYVPLLNSSTWTRVSFSFTVPAGCTSIYVDLARSSGNGTVNLWGAQLEAGAFATSYLPTVASQVTRAADSASMIGNNFARWYNVNEGTLFADAVQNATNTTVTQVASLDDSTVGGNNSRVRFYLNNSARSIQLTVYDSAGNLVVDMGGNTPLLSQGIFKKSAFALKANDFAQASDGGAVNSDTSGAMPTPNAFGIGNDLVAGSVLNGTIKRISYYNRRLANTELQGITS
jgi:hypothetical protein